MKHPVFSFSALFIPFLLIFPIFQTRQHIFCFLSLYLILLSLFCFFIVLTFFSLLDMLHSLSIFLAYLSLFFCVQFYVFPNSQRFLFFFSAFFTSYCHSSAPSPLSLLLSPVFLLFRPSLTAFASFQPFFSFSQLIFIFFSIFCLFRRFLPSFRHFSVFPPFFRFYLCHSSRLVFSRFTPLKMFHVKHRFSRFPVFSGQ